MSRTYRAAVIGCGLIGSRFAKDESRIGIYTHAGAYVTCPRTALCALCDTDGDAVAEAGARWGVTECFTDPVRMLEACQPDIVSVCTPDATHASMMRQMLRADSVRAIFAEKPLALRVDEARELLGAAGEKPVVTNYYRRFTSNHQMLKAHLDAGVIGCIAAVQGVYTKGLFHNGTHWFDLARWFVGEVSQVQAFDRLDEAGADPTVDVRLRFASGVAGSLIGLSSQHYSIFEMDIFGSAGRARLIDGGWHIDLASAGPSQRYGGYTTLCSPEMVGGDMRDPALHAVGNLVAHLDNSNVLLACSGGDGLHAMLIADAARCSLASGRAELVKTP